MPKKVPVILPPPPYHFKKLKEYLNALRGLDVLSSRFEKEGEWWLQEWSEWWDGWCAGEGAQFWWQDTPGFWCEQCRKFKKRTDSAFLADVGGSDAHTLCGELWQDPPGGDAHVRICVVTTCAHCASRRRTCGEPQDPIRATVCAFPLKGIRERG